MVKRLSVVSQHKYYYGPQVVVVVLFLLFYFNWFKNVTYITLRLKLLLHQIRIFKRHSTNPLIWNIRHSL